MSDSESDDEPVEIEEYDFSKFKTTPIKVTMKETTNNSQVKTKSRTLAEENRIKKEELKALKIKLEEEKLKKLQEKLNKKDQLAEEKERRAQEREKRAELRFQRTEEARLKKEQQNIEKEIKKQPVEIIKPKKIISDKRLEALNKGRQKAHENKKNKMKNIIIIDDSKEPKKDIIEEPKKDIPQFKNRLEEIRYYQQNLINNK